MNKQEAIETLKELNENYFCDGHDEANEAIETAISALQQQLTNGWAAVENGLPLKRFNEQGEPIEYVVMLRRASEPTTLSIDSHGTWYEPIGYYYNIPSLMSYEWDVIAWQPLPEPMEV